jgi:hypothetical protein
VEPGYVVLTFSKTVKHACVLGDLTGVDRVFELNKGVSRHDLLERSDKVAFRMNAEFPNDTVLTDSLINTDRLLVGSLRLKQFLQARGSKKIEYLPVEIIDHKGKIASRDYFIIHPVEPVNCIDTEKSGVVWNPVVKGKIRRLNKLVLDESRIDPDRELFRPDLFFDVILVRRDVAEAVGSQQFTGMRWIELDNYPEV